MTDTQNSQPDPRSFGFYGRSWEEIKTTPEALTHRLEEVLLTEKAGKNVYKEYLDSHPATTENLKIRLESDRATQLARRIEAASETDTRKSRPTLEEELKKEDAARGQVDWGKKIENELKTMGLDQYSYQPVPHILKDFIEGGEDD